MSAEHDQDMSFPPLMSGEETRQGALDLAIMRAATGCDAGLVVYRVDSSTAEAAMVFAPEVPLKEAVVMMPLCGVGFQNALGALAPPEVAVHLDWDGGIRVNGASCGHFSLRASDQDPDAVPDWLIVAFTLPLLPASDAPGTTPDETSLFAEGCAEVSPYRLIEAWARHSLHWINRWEDDGSRALHGEWRGLAFGVGEPATQDGQTGTFLGVDEQFGMLLRDTQTTHLIPLTKLLEEAP